MNAEKTGNLIAETRAALNLTQKELADRIGVTDKAVSKWERGKSMPDIALINRLASELKISIAEILTGEKSRSGRTSNLIYEKEEKADENYAEPISLSFGKEKNEIVSPYLFGSNLEHTRSCINAGLSAQMLRNRKFAGKPQACLGCAQEWYAVGEKTIFAFTDAYTRHGEGYHMTRMNECNAQSIMNPFENCTAGIGQHELSVQAEKEYEFAFVARTEAEVNIHVSLTARNGKEEYCAKDILVKGKEWERYVCTLKPGKTDGDADLLIEFEGRNVLVVGAVSLMPAENFRGMRKDVIALMKEAGIRVLRWPGGNFAGEYNWMDGLLPVDMRAPFLSYLNIETQPHSMGYDYHEINIDDFAALCREIGAEPFITINPSWNTPEENRAWVEYCNGDETTQYGRMRIERGYKEPYCVQLWSLGNEFGYGHMEGDNTPAGYAKIALENGRKMLEASCNLSLCSSGPYPNEQWAKFSARPLSEIARLVSQHFYAQFPHAKYTGFAELEEAYYTTVCEFRTMQAHIHKMRSMIDSSIRISFDEWNVWYAWYRPSSVTDGIFNALVMHMLIGEAEKSGIAMACHFEAVNEGMIRVLPDSACLTAQGISYSVMKHHAGGKLLRAERDIVITRHPDNEIYMTVINASLKCEKPVSFPETGVCREALVYTSDSVIPHSNFEKKDVTGLVSQGSMLLEPHSILTVRWADK